MDAMTARPQLLKQANLSSLRRVIKARGTATRAELAGATRISSTTVRSLLAEMLADGELESAGYDESSGGRKAERYRFSPGRYHCAAVCISDRYAHGLLANVYGEIVEAVELDAADGDFERAAVSFLDGLVRRHTIKAVGVGVPGIVEGGGYWRQDPRTGELARFALGDSLAQRYGLPVLLENDLNATTIGFGRCYEKEFPAENPENTNMAYLYFEKGCVSAGFLAGGRIVRGSRNFAGELGLVPMEDGRTLDDCLFAPSDDARYTSRVIQAVAWVCGILNPQYVALGGPGLRRDCIGPIGDGLSALLPRQMFAEILYAPDMWHDYHDGMAYLTAEKMFDEVQFVRE